MEHDTSIRTFPDNKNSHDVLKVVIFCATWHRFYNLKNVKNTHEECYLQLYYEQHSSMGVFHVFLNCINGTKSRNAELYT